MMAGNDDETKGKTDRPLLDKTEAEMRSRNDDEAKGKTDRPPLVENKKTEDEMRAKADSINMPIFFSRNWSDSEMKANIEGSKEPTFKPPNPPSFENFEGIPRCYCEAEAQRIMTARARLKIPLYIRDDSLPFCNCEKGRERIRKLRRDYIRLMQSGMVEDMEMPHFFPRNQSEGKVRFIVESLKIPTSRPPSPPFFRNFEGISRRNSEAELQRMMNERPFWTIPYSSREENLPFLENGREQTLNRRREYNRKMNSMSMWVRNDDEAKGQTDRPLLDKTDRALLYTTGGEMRSRNDDETKGKTDRPPLVENKKTEDEMRAKADSINMQTFFSRNWSDSEMKANIEGSKEPTFKPPNPPSFGNFEGIPRCYCEAEAQRIMTARARLKIPLYIRDESLPFCNCEKGRERIRKLRRDYIRLMQSGVDRSTTLFYSTPCPDTNTPQEPFNEKPKQRAESENDVDIWDADTLAEFHADALQQVGFGKYHVLMIIVCGLALAAHIGQIFSLFFILPSADMEFCMSPHQKELLIIISFSGATLGALICGSIAQVNGRKGTLLTCMICMTLFSVASAFMPTFGPFAMARFCAAACGGGIFPIAAVYLGEMVSSDYRSPCIGVFTSIGLIGGTAAAALSMFMLPMTGEQLLLEHKDHFRSWHRYLLFMTLSSVLPIIGLCILPESPYWLLNTGREVDALDVYKLIYTNNVYDDKCVVFECNVPAPVYKRDHYPYNVLIEMGVKVYKFIQSFMILLRPSHRNATMSLMMIWFGAMFVTFGLMEYVLRFGHIEYEQDFLSDMIIISSFTYENISFTANIIKQQFTDTRFLNCTFEQILLSYVQFKSCTFLETNFHGVKTANTTFVDSFLNNVKFIDTDISPGDFTNCVRNNTEFDRMTDGCDRQFNFSLFNEVGYRAHIAWLVPTLIIVMKTSFVLNQFGRVRASTVTLIMAAILCCLVGFNCFGEVIQWIVGIVQGLVISALVALTVQAIEYHAVALRCAIMGMCVCCAYIGAVVGLHVYSGLQMSDARTAAVLSVVGLSFPSALTTFLVDRP